MARLPDTSPKKDYKVKPRKFGGLSVRSLTGGYQHAIDPGVADVKGGSGKSESVNKTKAKLNARTKVGFKK